MYILFQQYSRLYSLRSAWMSLHSWYSSLITVSIYKQMLENYSQVFSIYRSLGAGMPSLPMKSMTSTLDLTSSGTGQGIIPQILFRFLSSFSAHILTIFLGLVEQQPRRNLNSPCTQRSRSLKTKIEVLQILTAYYFLPYSPFLTAQQTLASLPVDRQPLTQLNVELLINFFNMSIVLGSSTCYTVALCTLSLFFFSLTNSWFSHACTLAKHSFWSSLVYWFQWQTLWEPCCCPWQLWVTAGILVYQKSESESELDSQS